VDEELVPVVLWCLLLCDLWVDWPEVESIVEPLLMPLLLPDGLDPVMPVLWLPEDCAMAAPLKANALMAAAIT